MLLFGALAVGLDEEEKNLSNISSQNYVRITPFFHQCNSICVITGDMLHQLHSLVETTPFSENSTYSVLSRVYAIFMPYNNIFHSLLFDSFVPNTNISQSQSLVIGYDYSLTYTPTAIFASHRKHSGKRHAGEVPFFEP